MFLKKLLAFFAIVLLQLQSAEAVKADDTEIVGHQRKQFDVIHTKFDHPRAKIGRQSQQKMAVWSQPIPVLVIACNRPQAVRELLKNLLRFRPSKEQFPIIVSQDCDQAEVQTIVNKEFGNEVEYIKHASSEAAHLKVPPEHRQFTAYYKIARHYKLALGHVFDKLNHSTAIIVEDDLDVASDFYEYFLGTRPLLELDHSLFCVSAWNDNGKPELIDPMATALLYRSDFFPGLGWMMTRKFWLEIGPKWPAGFWDDFLREPEQRRNRACIRPEVSRTAMTEHGRIGASNGLFFDSHLKHILLNTRPVQFTQLDLHYLLRANYEPAFLANTYALPTITLEELVELKTGGKQREFRVEYQSMDAFVRIAQRIGLMADIWAGVPRTAYHGIVSCLFNGNRFFIAPPAKRNTNLKGL